jgi:hypothetical protein
VQNKINPTPNGDSPLFVRGLRLRGGGYQQATINKKEVVDFFVAEVVSL